jgi:hypothetical protein
LKRFFFLLELGGGGDIANDGSSREFPKKKKKKKLNNLIIHPQSNLTLKLRKMSTNIQMLHMHASARVRVSHLWSETNYMNISSPA